MVYFPNISHIDWDRLGYIGIYWDLHLFQWGYPFIYPNHSQWRMTGGTPGDMETPRDHPWSTRAAGTHQTNRVRTRSHRKPRHKGSFDVKEWIPSRWHVTSNMKVEGTNTWALTLCLGKDTEPKTGCGGFESREPILESGASKRQHDQTCVDIPRQTLKGKWICMH